MMANPIQSPFSPPSLSTTFNKLLVCLALSISNKIVTVSAFAPTPSYLAISSERKLCAAATPPTAPTWTRRSSRLRARPKSKWDDLVDEDDDNEEFGVESESLWLPDAPAASLSGSLAGAVPRDMRYEEANIRRQAETFDLLVDAGGEDVIDDVYVRSGGKKEWWLVGKVARVSDVSPEQAIERQWPLIDRHVWALRLPVRSPSDLTSPLEVWYAPGNTELDAARNDPNLTFVQVMPEKCEGAAAVAAPLVGFVGKTYGTGAPVFFVKRNVEDGTPCGVELEGDWMPSPSSGKGSD